MEEVVIVSGARTPVGAFNGSFANVSAADLGKVAIKAALERAHVKPEDVSEVILGQVLQAAQGQNPARQASKNAGLPDGSPAWSVNMVCGSGLRAVALGAQAIAQGDSAIVVAGGQESMSQSTHAAYLRAGQKMGNLEFIDTMIKDGLWDAFNGYHMGVTAENVAREWQITREQQDTFATASQNKAEAAKKAGRFKDEIAPVTVKERKGEKIIDTDEYIRVGATVEALAGLKPAFQKDGTVTAANASGINDGAAALVLMTRERSQEARAEAAREDQILGPGRRRSQGDGLRSHSGVAQGAREGRLEGERSRPGGSQRGVRGAGLRGEQGHGLGHGQGERQWRRDRHRPSDRCVGRAHSRNAAARDATARRKEGSCHAVHRRWHGYRDVPGALSIVPKHAVLIEVQ